MCDFLSASVTPIVLDVATIGVSVTTKGVK